MTSGSQWPRCISGTEESIIGNIWFRYSNEDPWIGIANGSHADSIKQDLIVWGENHYLGPHGALKLKHGGINVYLRPNPPSTA